MDNIINSLPLLVVFLVLIIGFVLLIKGADFFVDGASSIAKKFHIPSVIVGLTIIAMGTSLPETAVSVTASLNANNELAISNAIGSNIFNLLMVIGVCASIKSMNIRLESIQSDIPFSAFCALLLFTLGVLGVFDTNNMTLGHIDGLLLLIIFVLYILSLIKRAKASNQNLSDEEVNDNLSIPVSIISILAGGAGIAIGGSITVSAASNIALRFGMSQTLVGLTIVSIGTSLPELVTSIIAARKGEVDMALGNAIGSNIFNILMVLGIASSISPIIVIKDNLVDIILLLIFTLIVWFIAFTHKKISQLEGYIMVVIYLGYTAYIIIR